MVCKSLKTFNALHSSHSFLALMFKNRDFIGIRCVSLRFKKRNPLWVFVLVGECDECKKAILTLPGLPGAVGPREASCRQSAPTTINHRVNRRIPKP